MTTFPCAVPGCKGRVPVVGHTCQGHNRVAPRFRERWEDGVERVRLRIIKAREERQQRGIK